MYFHKWVKGELHWMKLGVGGMYMLNTYAIPSYVVNNIVSLMDRWGGGSCKYKHHVCWNTLINCKWHHNLYGFLKVG
jgi:hypothetical protein